MGIGSTGTDLVSEDKKYSTDVLSPTGLNVDEMHDDDSAPNSNALHRSYTHVINEQIIIDNQ